MARRRPSPRVVFVAADQDARVTGRVYRAFARLLVAEAGLEASVGYRSFDLGALAEGDDRRCGDAARVIAASIARRIGADLQRRSKPHRLVAVLVFRDSESQPPNRASYGLKRLAGILSRELGGIPCRGVVVPPTTEALYLVDRDVRAVAERVVRASPRARRRLANLGAVRAAGQVPGRLKRDVEALLLVDGGSKGRLARAVAEHLEGSGAIPPGLAKLHCVEDTVRFLAGLA